MIEAHIMAWNEADMLPFTLQHYASFCSRIVVYDNMSNDGSNRVYGEFGAAMAGHQTLEVIKFDTEDRIDEREYLRIKNQCWKKSQADWVIVCDCDEFLYDSVSVSTALENYKRNGIDIVRTTGFQMFSETLPQAGAVYSIFDNIKYGVPDAKFNKSVVFRPQALAEINYLPGCHECIPKAAEAGKSVNYSYSTLKLLHCHYIDRDRVKKRHEAYNKRLSYYNRTRKYGIEYQAGPGFVDKQFDMLRQTAELVI